MTNPIISKTCKFVENKLAGDGSGHDWWHIFRVWTLAKKIAAEEKAQLETVELGALLHDIADWKFHNGDDSIGPAMAQEFLSNNDVDPQLTESVVDIVSTISYKGAGVATPMKTLEGKIVQDADRLDAIGAIGILRNCACAQAISSRGNEVSFYHSSDPLGQGNRQLDDKRYAIDHYKLKLLKLIDGFLTPLGKQEATRRHQRLEIFLSWIGDECQLETT